MVFLAWLLLDWFLLVNSGLATFLGLPLFGHASFGRSSANLAKCIQYVRKSMPLGACDSQHTSVPKSPFAGEEPSNQRNVFLAFFSSYTAYKKEIRYSYNQFSMASRQLKKESSLVTFA